MGDYDPGRHSPGYVSEFRFFATQTEEMEAEIESGHASMSGWFVVYACIHMVKNNKKALKLSKTYIFHHAYKRLM